MPRDPGIRTFSRSLELPYFGLFFFHSSSIWDPASLTPTVYASELAKTVNANTRAELQKGFGGVFWFKKIRPVDEFLIKQAACQGGARRQKSVGRGVDVGVKRLRNA